jgi:hypothetical protein
MHLIRLPPSLPTLLLMPALAWQPALAQTTSPAGDPCVPVAVALTAVELKAQGLDGGTMRRAFSGEPVHVLGFKDGSVIISSREMVVGYMQKTFPLAGAAVLLDRTGKALPANALPARTCQEAMIWGSDEAITKVMLVGTPAASNGAKSPAQSPKN